MSRIFWNRKLILKIRLTTLHPLTFIQDMNHPSPSILHPPFFTRHPSPSILQSYRRIWSLTLMKPFLSTSVLMTSTCPVSNNTVRISTPITCTDKGYLSRIILWLLCSSDHLLLKDYSWKGGKIFWVWLSYPGVGVTQWACPRVGNSADRLV